VTINVTAWADEQRLVFAVDLGAAKRIMRELLRELHTLPDPAQLRSLLERFEAAEGSVAKDLGLLEPFYRQFPAEYGWRDATDQELAMAARAVFGGSK